jgi:thiol:disulfide interchange protein DsbG
MNRKSHAVAVAGIAALAVFAAAHAKQPTEAELPGLYAALEKSDAVVEGSPTPNRTLYVFFDANCWYCHLTWTALQPYEKAGLQVRWVPVAYQKESSTTKAAAIMLAKNRAAAMRENELGYKQESYDGAIAPATATKAIEAKLEANFKLMDRFGVSGTPGLVWKDGRGRVRVQTGMPRLAHLPAITGLPEQKVDDPRLKEFR